MTRITESIVRFLLLSITFVACAGTLLVEPLLAQTQAGEGNAGGENWPFGVAPGASRMAKKFDLFNLGLLGAKAWDADRPEPSAEMTQGKRRTESSPFDGKDDGPSRLVVRALLGGGPAQQAGIKLGDVILGAGKKKFSKGSFAPLAAALVAAESKRGTVEVTVERDGKTQKIVVTIPVTSAAAKKPAYGEQRRKIVDDALAFLAQQQQGDGGFAPTLGGVNGQSVNACLAGLAWLAGGSSLTEGPYKENLAKARDFVVKSLGQQDRLGTSGGANWDQTNWKYAHAGIFLGELQLRSPADDLKPVLSDIATKLCARQEASGGFAHGPGGPNALGYLELNIVGGFVVSALGQVKQAGAQFDQKVVTQLNAYLEKSSSGSGGVAYSTKAGQIGHGNVGRTAIAWLGNVGLGLRSKPFPKKMEKWLKREIASVMSGHASLMQHIMLAGVAAKALGSKSTKAYWKVLERDLTLCRCPDGSIQMRPWHESLNMGSNSDVTMGQIWSTASWAIVLAADGFANQGEVAGGLPGWIGTRAK